MFDFTVTPDGGEPYDVTATSRDVLVFEKTTRGINLSTWRDKLTMAYLYRLAHLASLRTGKFHGDLAAFEAEVDVDFRDEEELTCPQCDAALRVEDGRAVVDPTRPDPGTGT